MHGHWRLIEINCFVVGIMDKKYLPEILVLIGQELYATNPNLNQTKL